MRVDPQRERIDAFQRNSSRRGDGDFTLHAVRFPPARQLQNPKPVASLKQLETVFVPTLPGDSSLWVLLDDGVPMRVSFPCMCRPGTGHERAWFDTIVIRYNRLSLSADHVSGLTPHWDQLGE